MRYFARMFPSRRQWQAWTLPSKLTAVSAYITIFLFLLPLLSFFISSFLEKNAPEIEFRSIAETASELLIEGGNEGGFILSSAQYPHVTGLVNKDFEKYVNERILDVAYQGIERDQLIEHRSSWEVGLVRPEMLSLYAQNLTYYDGRANYPFVYRSLNFDLNQETEVELSDLLTPPAQGFLENLTYLELMSRDIQPFIGPGAEIPNYFPRLDEIQFFVKNNELNLLFSSYEVAAGVHGSIVVTLGLDQVSPFFVRGSAIDRYYRSIRGRT